MTDTELAEIEERAKKVVAELEGWWRLATSVPAEFRALIGTNKDCVALVAEVRRLRAALDEELTVRSGGP